MLKRAFYFFMKNYMAVVKYFYFGKVELVGMEKIPIGKPIIYSCNHQNAFMDALLIGSISPVKITSLTRSDVFGSHAGMWFMTALQMQPIYRMRDGIQQLEKNDEVFENVRNKLKEKEGVLIFSEGNHGNEYFLRPLSKGSSRMALESQEQMEDLDIQVVPVGINYFHHQRPFHKLTVCFGDPIKVHDYWDTYQEHPAKGINQLKTRITEGMKKCLLIPEESEDYIDKRGMINRKNEKISFPELRESIGKNQSQGMSPENPFVKKLGVLLGVFNFLPLLILQFVLKGIKDVVFFGSLKWVTALFLFPLWWLILFLVVSQFYGLSMAIGALVQAVVLLFVRQWLIRMSNVRH
jgi:1-acyl-sn-glycerol-3-phosphate acyltransferase